ncbi:MAG: flavodoxin domain-containing protein [Verrucomicrobiaceae bacterium]|nr:flavodoxin domain-containing protein [Verrucomicrobiaceae bacterium]
MPVAPAIPDNAPFSAEQRAWLNGFIAGLLNRAQTGTAAGATEQTKTPLLIAFGSQSGNAESYAKKLAKEAAAKGFTARAESLDAVQAADLTREKNVLIISSTWGEGDMPDNAQTFWSALNQNGSSPKLDGVRYSVLALGDKNYSGTFCLAGKKLDARLEELGAQRVAPRVDCDVDFDAPAKKWSAAAFNALNGSSSVRSDLSEQSDSSGSGYSKARPFPAPLLQNHSLNARGSSKDTRHIAFSLKGSGLSYEAGDALGVCVKNCPDVVDAVIKSHGLDPTAAVPLPDEGSAPLRDALISHYGVREWFGKTPEKPLSPDEFVSSLRKLQPRLYSISSSPKAHPGEVHLTVGVVRYEKDGTAHKGVASTFLADRLAIGDTTGVFIHTSPHFRPPADQSLPVIMVGPGTGIAPFRAFLEERGVTGATGKNWLFFGDQRRATDFLYHDQIMEWLKSGHLTRLDTAFSRDQAEKVYVQNRMMSAASELWQWLDEGGHFYVCGDASRMAKDVDAALLQVIQTAGGKTAEDAAAYMADMKKAKRYLRDVY